MTILDSPRPQVDQLTPIPYPKEKKKKTKKKPKVKLISKKEKKIKKKTLFHPLPKILEFDSKSNFNIIVSSSVEKENFIFSPNNGLSFDTLSPLEILLLNENKNKQQTHYNRWFNVFRSDSKNLELLNRFKFQDHSLHSLYPKITQITARCKLNSHINIYKMAERLNNAQTERKCVVLTNLYPCGQVSINENGNMQLRGINQIEHTIYVANEVSRRIQQAHNPWILEEENKDIYKKIENYENFYIEHIMARVNLQFRIHLSRLNELFKDQVIYRANTEDEIDYEEGELGKFVYKFCTTPLEKNKEFQKFITIRIVHTGILQFTGAKEPEHILLAFSYIVPLLMNIFVSK